VLLCFVALLLLLLLLLLHLPSHEQYLLAADSLQSMQSWIDAIERARLQALELRASLTLNNMFHYVHSVCVNFCVLRASVCLHEDVFPSSVVSFSSSSSSSSFS
jgi:hypothetical protein